MPHPRPFVFALLAGAFGAARRQRWRSTLRSIRNMSSARRSPRHDENANYRYHRVRQYQAQRDRVDGLLFASSRGRAFDADRVAPKSRRDDRSRSST